jgi:hypothetical protein
MLFVLLDDGTLDVVENPEQAYRDYEGIDVESGAFQFYDNIGRRLKVRFTVPNRSELFGFVRTSGKYVLEPAEETAGGSLELILLQTPLLNPNPWFKSLDEIKAYLSKHGVGSSPAQPASSSKPE